MRNDILTVAEMYAADRFAAEYGVPSLTLMERAGEGISGVIRQHFTPRPTVILCGPGNNGGDGFVVGRLLAEAGWPVTLALHGEPDDLKGDAATNAARWTGDIHPISPRVLEGAGLVVDALFGAGLSRPLEKDARETVLALKAAHTPIVAVDVPSGIAGDSGQPLSDAFVRANRTVTFFRKKPAHVLMPGRLYCGVVDVVQIGIPDRAIGQVGPAPALCENTPDLWGGSFVRPAPLGHKYARGHAVVVSGPLHATGAARLAARAALRIGAGLVSVASPADAVAINAAHLTAIMVKPFETVTGLTALLDDTRLNAVVVGPGLGVGAETRNLVMAVLKSGAATVLDADAISAFAAEPQTLFDRLSANTVLTPHAGEFERVFPGLYARHDGNGSGKLGAVREAAKKTGAVVLLKGPDTVIAAPDGAAAICTNAPPTLATAGSGDVLAGLIGGLMAQHMPPFLAACAGAWLHGEAANAFGPGLIAEDLPEALPKVLRRFYGDAT